MNRTDVLQAVARGWCSPANSHKVMDPDLAEAITDEVLALSASPPVAAQDAVLHELARSLRNRADSGAVHHSREWCYGVRFAANEVDAAIAASGAGFPECSGNPADCPENEGLGCCRRNDGTDWPPSSTATAAQSAPAAAPGDGFVLVPREPTEDALQDAVDEAIGAGCDYISTEQMKAAYAAFLAAAATAPPVGCTMGVGCDESGVCYAAAHGQPDRCCKPTAPVAAPHMEPLKQVAVAGDHGVELREPMEDYFDAEQLRAHRMTADDAMVTKALDGLLPNGHRVWAYVACANPDPNVTGREVMRAALEAIAGAQP